MGYIGTWYFHSIGITNAKGKLVYLDGEEFVDAPTDLPDCTDMEALEKEMHERRVIAGSQIRISDDGKLGIFVPREKDGMTCDKTYSWEERDGELWFDAGVEAVAFSKEDGMWVNPIDENGLFNFMAMRYERKADE